MRVLGGSSDVRHVGLILLAFVTLQPMSRNPVEGVGTPSRSYGGLRWCRLASLHRSMLTLWSGSCRLSAVINATNNSCYPISLPGETCRYLEEAEQCSHIRG